MCGIAGIMGTIQSREDQQKTIKDMISTLEHRGPDGWGVYCSNEVALGHTRLSIIDLQCGKQPMCNDRYVISYNGEIYNYIELREEMVKAGQKFKTTSDTEVVLKAFETYGINCFKKLNGQFALLIWDKQEKKLIAARDRYGIRPLYVLNHNEKIYFSSELKAFDRITDYQRELSMEDLYDHSLLWNTIGDRTIFKNIRSVCSGTFEIYQDSRLISSDRYYEIGETSEKSNLSFEETKTEFTELLEDSISLRLRSDVPVGAYLSGGVDSSVITHLTSGIKQDRLKSFSVSFSDSEFDESGFQNEMVNHLGSEHEDLNISYKDINENFINAAYHFERPVFRTAPVPLYLLSKKVHQSDIKVVLTGEAADEILFGYDSFKELVLLDEWKKSPESGKIDELILMLYPHLNHYKDPKKFGFIKMYYENFLNDYDNNLASLNIRSSNNKIVGNFFNKDYNISYSKENLLENMKKELPENFNHRSLLEKNQFLEMKTLLQGYLLSCQGDRMSMAHSIEGRYPFLDHRLVERVFTYGDNFKLKGFSQKHLLREAFRDKIPASIIDRPKKPYTAPDLKSFFMNGKLSEQNADFLSEERIKEYGIFDPKMVKRFIRKFQKGVPEDSGYRDNMLISFILSAQMIKYWIENTPTKELYKNENSLEIYDYH